MTTLPIDRETELGLLVAAPEHVDNKALVADRQRIERNKPTLGQAVVDAVVGGNSPITWGARQVRDFMQFDRDPDFKGIFANDAQFKAMTNGLDPDMWPMLEDADSLPHAYVLASRARGIQDARNRLRSLGWKGAAINIAADVLDPVSITVGVASGGVGWAARGAWAARAAKTGLIAAGTEAALQGYVATQDPQHNAADVLLNAGFAFVMGGAIGALIPEHVKLDLVEGMENEGAAHYIAGAGFNKYVNPNASAETLAKARLANKNLLGQNGKKIEPALDGSNAWARRRAEFATFLDDHHDADVLKAIDDHFAADPEHARLTAWLYEREPVNGRFEGAPDVPKTGSGKTAFDFDPNVNADAVSTRTAARFDMVGLTGDSAAPSIRLAGALLAGERLLRKAGGKLVAASDSATEWIRRVERRQRRHRPDAAQAAVEPSTSCPGNYDTPACFFPEL